MYLILLVLFYVFAPLLILHLCHRFPFVNKLGAVVIAYAVGLILGNIGILPEGSEKVQNILTTITIPLALPLLLFSVNIRSWFKIAGKTMLSMLLALIGVVVMVILGHHLFKNDIADSWKISGMLIGVYTGGTPNLASIQTALGIDNVTYIATHTYDMVISAAYLFVLMSVGQRLFGYILPKYRKISNDAGAPEDFDGKDPFEGVLQKKNYIPLLKGLGISVLIFAAGGSLTLFLPDNISMAAAILTITTLGILFSLVPSVNKIEKTFELGMYFILIFSIVVASMADIKKFSMISPDLFYYVTMTVFGSLVIHIFLSKIFKVDADTVIITSTAFICSPPFVPVVAGALKNKEIIVSGLTVGIIGYAIGNYLGVFIAFMLK